MKYRVRRSAAVSAWIRDARRKPDASDPCPGFFVYRGFTGCPAWAAEKPCGHCPLRRRLRRDPKLAQGVAWVDAPPSLRIESARAAVTKWLLKAGEQGESQVLHAGYLADSFAFPPEVNPHLGMLLDLFQSPEANPHGHTLLLATKCDLQAATAHLNGRAPTPTIVLSWYVGNAPEVEPAVPEPSDRIHAARKMAGCGWRVRVWLSPVCSGPGRPRASFWGEAIALHQTGAEMVILEAERDVSGRPVREEDPRRESYGRALAGLSRGGYQGQVALCKESIQVPRAARDDETNVPCPGCVSKRRA